MSLPSIGGCKRRTHVPFMDAPVTIASNFSPTLDSNTIDAADFPTCRSTFFAASSSRYNVLRACPIHHLCRAKMFSHRCFEQPLRNQIGKAAVQRHGVSIIFYRKSEVPGECFPGSSTTYSPAPNNLMTLRQRSGKRTGSAAFAESRN